MAATTNLTLCGVPVPGGSLPGPALGQGYLAGPDGQSFLRPVSVVLPFDPTRIPPGQNTSSVQIEMVRGAGSPLVALQSTVDLASATVTSMTTQFSQFAPVANGTPLFLTTPPALPDGIIGAAYVQTLQASAGTGPYTWTLGAGSALPPGLTLDPGGAFGGTPTLPGAFDFSLAATDSAGHAVQQAFTMTVNSAVNPAPVLASISPNGAAQGSTDTDMAVAGSGFAPEAQVLWDNAPLATTFVSSTSLAATIPAADLVATGAHSIRVSNPAPGGGTSASLSFAVAGASQNPVPTIASVSPTEVGASGVDTQIAVTGTNFIAVTTAAIGSQPIPTQYVSATALNATIPASYLKSPGTLEIDVVNSRPGGGYSPTSIPLTVGALNPLPVVSTLFPTFVTAGGADFALSVTGSNFLQGGQVFFNGTALGTTVTSATAAQAVVTASLITVPRTVQVEFVNPPPGGGPSSPVNFSIAASGDAGPPPTSLAWTQIPMASSWPPQRDDLHAMAALGNVLVLFGGYDGATGGTILNDTWTWGGSTWTQLHPAQSPPARAEHAIATFGNVVILFGGSAPGGTLLNDTWQWDGTTWTELHPAHSPAARASHGLAAAGNLLVLFGGTINGPNDFNDTWTWDGTDWTPSPTPAAITPRAAVAFASYGSKAVLFGGAQNYTIVNGNSSTQTTGNVNDTWEWQAGTWTQRMPATSPPPTSRAAMTAIGTSLVLFGQFPMPDGGVGTETWSWDGINWTLLSQPNNPPLYSAGSCGTLGSALYMVAGASNAMWKLSP